MVNDKEKAEFDAYSRTYDQHVNSALGFTGLKVDYFTKVKTAYIQDIIKRQFAGKSVRLFDLGCGIGNYHAALRPQVDEMAGVDVSSACIETARRRNAGVQYAVFDGLSLPLESEAFDFGIAICVFHHVPVSARVQLLKDARRVLRPGGFFAIFEHNPHNPLTMRVVNRCEFDKDAVLLKATEAETLLTSAGFTAPRSRFILTIPTFGLLSRNIDTGLGRLSFGAQYYTLGVA